MHTLLHCLALSSSISFAAAATSYANQFVDPQFLLDKSRWSSASILAQNEIIAASVDLASQGPWTVTSKTILPPSKDKRDYLSWPPYAWPDCSKVGNTTALTDEQVWTTCPYITRDGLFNPDQRLVNDTGAFAALSDAVFYNAIAWRLTSTDNISNNVASYIKTWFVDEATAMNPNLNYGQLLRGPGEQHGQHVGVLDLKCMSKLASAVLTLRLAPSPAWTQEIDQGLKAWAQKYIGWLTSSNIALEEKAATNNHGSFYYNQLASLYLIIDDKDNARKTIQEYFEGIYQGQIDANGEQPLEALRTRPYHYRAYNLAAMITNARLGEYAGLDAWNLKTAKGGTILAAADFTMALDPASSGEDKYAFELYPVIAAIATHYGDSTGKYQQFLNSHADSSEPFFFWETSVKPVQTTAPTSSMTKVSTSTRTGTPTPASGGVNGAGSSFVFGWTGLGAASLSVSFISLGAFLF